MSKSRKEFVKAYKVTSSNGFWAIIAADDDFVAKNTFAQEYHYPDKAMNNMKTEVLAKDVQIYSPFYKDTIAVKYVLNLVKFSPRVLTDSSDITER